VRRSPSTRPASLSLSSQASREWAETGRRILIEGKHTPDHARWGHAEAVHLVSPLQPRLLPHGADAGAAGTQTGKRRRHLRPRLSRRPRFARASPQTTAERCAHRRRRWRPPAGHRAGPCGRRPCFARVASLLAAGARPDGDMPEEVMWVTGALGIERLEAPRGARGRRSGPGGRRYPGGRLLSPRPASTSPTRAGAITLSSTPGHTGSSTGATPMPTRSRWCCRLPGSPSRSTPGAVPTLSTRHARRPSFEPGHNTLTLDGRSQSQPDGPSTGRRPRRLLANRWHSNGRVRLLRGVRGRLTCQRDTIEQSSATKGDAGSFSIGFSSAREHVADVFWHRTRHGSLKSSGPGLIRCNHSDGTAAWLVTTLPQIEPVQWPTRVGSRMALACLRPRPALLVDSAPAERGARSHGNPVKRFFLLEPDERDVGFARLEEASSGGATDSDRTGRFAALLRRPSGAEVVVCQHRAAGRCPRMTRSRGPVVHPGGRQAKGVPSRGCAPGSCHLRPGGRHRHLLHRGSLQAGSLRRWPLRARNVEPADGLLPPPERLRSFAVYNLLPRLPGNRLGRLRPRPSGTHRERGAAPWGRAGNTIRFEVNDACDQASERAPGYDGSSETSSRA